MKSKIITTLFLFVLLTACAGQQEITVTQIPVPSITDTPTNITPTPTRTSLPKVTPSPTIDYMETIPIATLNAVATLDMRRSDLVFQYPELESYPVSCSIFSCTGIQISPNGNITLFTNGNVVHLYEADGAKIGSYSFHDIYGYQIDYWGGYVFPVHWTNDGEYLYLSANPGGDGGPEPYFGYISALVRVNLENGTWKDTGILGSFAISPSDAFIIYSKSKSQIRVRNWSTGQEQIYILPKDFLYFGSYVWSPDSQKIVFTGTPEDWYAVESRFALWMIDMKNQTVAQLYESTLPFYSPVRWEEPEKIVLNKFNDWGEWILDVSETPPVIIPK